MRTFSADEITRILGSQIHDPDLDISIDLGNGLRAVMGAMVYKALKKGEKPDHYKFFLEDGTARGQRELEKATEEELAKISEFLWKNVAPQFLSSHEILDPELTPDSLLDPPEDNDMTPLELRDPEPDDADLEPDPTGLTPDALRNKKGPDKPTLDDLLTPDALK